MRFFAPAVLATWLVFGLAAPIAPADASDDRDILEQHNPCNPQIRKC